MPFSDRGIEAVELVITTGKASRAQVTLAHAVQTSTRFLGLFDQTRRGARGTTTDEQQDLLRSMFVFAMAGLDATVKQLIRDALPVLVLVSEQAEQRLEDFAAKRLEGGRGMIDSQFLVRLLRATNAHDALVTEFVADLTSSSMQSVPQLLNACAALGIEDRELLRDIRDLKTAFGVRNSIIHEMDVNLDALNRNRTSRTKAMMVRESNRVLSTAHRLVEAVDSVPDPI